MTDTRKLDWIERSGPRDVVGHRGIYSVARVYCDARSQDWVWVVRWFDGVREFGAESSCEAAVDAAESAVSWYLRASGLKENPEPVKL